MKVGIIGDGRKNTQHKWTYIDITGFGGGIGRRVQPTTDDVAAVCWSSGPRSSKGSVKVYHTRCKSLPKSKLKT